MKHEISHSQITSLASIVVRLIEVVERAVASHPIHPPPSSAALGCSGMHPIMECDNKVLVYMLKWLPMYKLQLDISTRLEALSSHVRVWLARLHVDLHTESY